TAGRAAVRKAADGLAAAGVKVPWIRTSPALRSAETARILADEIGARGEVELWEELKFGSAPESVIQRLLHQGPRTGTTILVGHEPGLGQLAGVLLFGEAMAPIRLRRAGAALIEVPRRVGPSAGRLEWAMTRGQLIALGKA
ncbi:MAG: hypothetical protein L3J91_06805, partial [Thermoplasmata archaeon]|nr:hypothetical protein [Thermoplasmata archaeon]